MQADEFIRRWGANQRTEAAAKAHFLDLCALLDVPPPTDDATGEDYAFEKEVAKADGRKGFADVWRRGCFGWEYKSRGRNLADAHDQLLRYAGALGNPPLLVASDMAAIVVRTNFTGIVTKETSFGLDDLRDAAVRDRLRLCWTGPDAWKPTETRQGVTERAAADFAELAKRLRARGHNAPTVAHFVNRLVFCLFAKDTRLLDAALWAKLLDLARRDPACFEGWASQLFRAMQKPGGRIGFDAVPWFNGGLFDDDRALPLTGDDVDLLVRASRQDWGEIDPSIFGTLFERGLNPERQAQLGAHYTDRDKIDLIVQAVVARPLEAEWK